MSTTRPFAYNPSLTPIGGTTQVGTLAIGYGPLDYSTMPGGVEWWNGPDESLGYVVASPVASNGQPTNVPEDVLTLSSTYKGTDIVLSNNNQTATQVFGYQQSVLGETIISGSNKVMFSVLCNLLEPQTLIGSHVIGIGLTSMNYQGNPYGGYPGNDTNSIGFSDDGKYYFNGNIVQSGLPTWTDGDIIDIVISHGQYWWIRVNGGNWNNDQSADPTTLTNGLTMNGLTNYYPVLCPSYQGIMTVLNHPRYGVPSNYNFLGNLTASIGFYRTNNFDDGEFIHLSNSILNSNYTAATDASVALTTNGFWNSYATLTSPVLSLDAGNQSSYPGTGTVWTDLIGGKQFNLINGPGYDPSDGGKIYFNAPSGQYAECSTSLSTLTNWTVGVWHYYDGTNIGGSPCIVTEVFPGTNNTINYIIGNGIDTSPNLQTGFFTAGWNVTSSGYVLSTGWHYIVATYDGTLLKLYVDNTLIDTLNTTTSSLSSNGGIRLMRRWDLGEYWGGYLSTVDIYNEALGDSEITLRWNITKSRFGL
jgi:hypothetical protein